jgi:predicted small lipoprotein YifL
MRLLKGLFVLAALGALAGCGGSGGHGAAPLQTTTATTSTTSSSGPGALQAEATSAAAGDIPDNQVFLVFRSAAGYSMKYPEGWAQQGSGDRVTFRDKNNIARIDVSAGVALTLAGVRVDVARLSGAHVQSPPQAITVSGSSAFKVVYSTESSPNAVTGKRVKLVVDRYYLSKGGRRAVVDLGTPEGVDNVDAYRLMIESFRWK